MHPSYHSTPGPRAPKMLLTLLLLLLLAASKTTVGRSDLGVDGTLFAFRDDLKDDPLEARTRDALVVGKGVVHDPAAAKDTGATFRIHGLCHIHNLAREMELARLGIARVPNLVWQDSAVAAHLETIIESIIDCDTCPQPLTDFCLATCRFGLIVGYEKEYAMLIDAISVSHLITSVLQLVSQRIPEAPSAFTVML